MVRLQLVIKYPIRQEKIVVRTLFIIVRQLHQVIMKFAKKSQKDHQCKNNVLVMLLL